MKAEKREEEEEVSIEALHPTEMGNDRIFKDYFVLDSQALNNLKALAIFRKEDLSTLLEEMTKNYLFLTQANIPIEWVVLAINFISEFLNSGFEKEELDFVLHKIRKFGNLLNELKKLNSLKDGVEATIYQLLMKYKELEQKVLQDAQKKQLELFAIERKIKKARQELEKIKKITK